MIDALALRAHIGAALGPIFADPAILKVLHGADSDVIWLQRDFGVYLVNMFDTGQASRVLEYPRNSLAYLLDHFCGVKVRTYRACGCGRARGGGGGDGVTG